MTYHNAHKFIVTAPDTTNTSANGNNLKTLWNLLSNPQRNLKYLHLVGSNGKTVCAELLKSAYKDSGIKLGCLATNIRTDLRSNIHINGSPVSYEEMARYVETIYKIIHDQNKPERIAENGQAFVLTKQELLLSVALLAFRENNCELCFIESDHSHSDPTVFLPPPFSVAICGAIPTSKDDVHMIRSYISHGIQEIISAPQDQDAYKMISDICSSVNCRLTIPTKSEVRINKLTLSGSEFSYKGIDYKIGMCGKFQINNAVFVLELMERLSARGYGISEEKIRESLKNTKIAAKFEVLSIMPTIIADSTHSDVAISTVCESMSDFRDIIGSKIRLCLPDGVIVDKYLKTLTEQGYNINKVVVVGSGIESTNVDFIYCQKPKEIINQILDDLGKDETLLISGPSSFTLELRYELLSRLGF